MSFDQVFADTLALEGGYSEDPSDSGGATRYGITERVARANGYTGPMRELSLETARRIAKTQYWDTLRLDDVDAVSAAVARELFDTGYNMGVGTAGKILQRSLNALNREQADYPDVTVDGLVGPMTIASLRALVLKRGEPVVLKALNILQGAAYIDIVERRPKDERFIFGWLMNRVAV